MFSNETPLEVLTHLRSHMSPGCVLTPDEVDAECATLKQPPLLHEYAIYAELPLSRVLALEDESIAKAVRFTLFPSPSNVMHGLVSLQAGAQQIRFVVSLAEEKTRGWLKCAVSQGRVILATNIAETDQLAITSVPLPLPGLGQLKELLVPQPAVDKSTTFDDATTIAKELLRPDALSSCLPGIEVRDVYLVLAWDWLNRPVRASRSSKSGFH